MIWDLKVNLFPKGLLQQFTVWGPALYSPESRPIREDNHTNNMHKNPRVNCLLLSH